MVTRKLKLPKEEIDDITDNNIPDNLTAHGAPSDDNSDTDKSNDDNSDTDNSNDDNNDNNSTTVNPPPFVDDTHGTQKDYSIRFMSRRNMAWVSLISMIIVTLLMMFVVPPERIKVLESVITWFYMGVTTVIGAYMGTTTYAFVAGMRK